MNPRSEGGTVSSAPPTSGEKHGDEDELTDGTGDCWAGGRPRDSVSEDDHGTASYKPETLQDAYARFKAVKDKGHTSPSCLEEKAGAAVEGSDLRVLVEGMLAVTCPTYRGLCAEEAQVPSTKAFNARKTLYNAKRLLHLYKTVHGLSGVWPDVTLLALHSDVDFQIRTRLRSRLSRQDFPGILAVEDNELKLQLAEVLVALAKAVYDLSAVGAALTPHNLENLQMCRDLLHAAGMGEPEVPLPRPVIFKRSPKKEAAAAAKAKNAPLVGSPNGSRSGNSGKNRGLHEAKNPARRREAMPHHEHATNDRPHGRYAQAQAAHGYPAHASGQFGGVNEWSPPLGPAYHQGQQAFAPQAFVPRTAFYENNYASLNTMHTYARNPYIKFESSMP